MNGFYQFTTKIKDTLKLDPFVNTVTYGDIFQVDLNKKTIFPLSHLVVNNVTKESNVMRFNISILAMDIVDVSKEATTDVFIGNDNTQDIWHTQFKVLDRLTELLRRGSIVSDGYKLDGNPTFEHFTERFENYLAGWTVTFDVLVGNDMTICEVGSSGSSCSPAGYVITDSNGTQIYNGTIASGEVGTIVIQNATVENSDASYSASILAEGSLVLPDVTVDVQNSALTVVNTATVASVQDVTISAPDGTINIKKTGDGTIHNEAVPSGATVDYDVANNDITVNGANDFTIHATDSLDIVLKDTTGATVTPTSVTPHAGTHHVDIVLSASGTPIDVDAQAFLTATGLSGVNEILAVNTFVTEAKSQGIWNDLDKIYPFIGGTSTAHRYNLKNALADGTFFGGVTHNSNGVTFNGTTGYFNTGWATNGGNLYNRHFSQYVVTQNSSTAWAGSYDGTNLFGLRTDQARVLDYVGLNSLYALSPVVNLVRASMMCANIDSSTVGKVYSNGLLVFTNTGAINASPTTNTVYVGALNFNGTASFFHDSNVRFVTTGNKLDASKQAILNNLARYFNAILGR